MCVRETVGEGSTNQATAPARKVRPRPSKRKRRLFASLFALLICSTIVFLLECALRVLPLVLAEPRASFFVEAGRIPLSNTRMYDGVAICLPATERADLLVVGDSFPFGTYVRESDAFPARLGKSAARSAVNLGVGSQSPPQYNRMLEVGARYRPSRVLYCIFANDFNYPESPAVAELSSARTRQSLPGDRHLFLEALDWTDRLYMARKHCTNWFLSFQLLKLRQQPQQNVRRVLWHKGNLVYAFADKQFWDQVNYDNPRVQRGIDLNVRFVEAAQRFCRSIGASLTVILLPSKEMVYGPFCDVGKEIYCDAHHRTYRELARRLADVNIPCRDLTEPLRSLAGQDKPLYFTIDGHFNDYGHEKVAELLVDCVKLRTDRK